MNQKIQTKATYTPSSIISVFDANVPRMNEEKKLVNLCGVYQKSAKRSYQGCYFDKLQDEFNTNYQLTLKVPELIRKQLVPGQVIQFKGYFTRRTTNYGQIELQANLHQLVDLRNKEFTDRDLKQIEVQRKKQDIGYRNCDEFIRNALYDERIINVTFLIGDNSIIESDIFSLFRSGRDKFRLTCEQTNFNSTHELKTAVDMCCIPSVDIVCLVRGGGSYLERFDDPELAEHLVSIPKILISAIGHTDDVTLVEKIADKKLPVPAAIGEYFTGIVETSVEEFEKSKARIAIETQKKIAAQYEEKFKHLEQKNKDEKASHKRCIDEQTAISTQKMLRQILITPQNMNTGRLAFSNAIFFTDQYFRWIIRC